MRVRSVIIAITLLACAGAAHAQDRTLDRVENLIATGRLTDARTTLAEWERENTDLESTATSDDRARALFLTGALSVDAEAAEDAFIGVVLGYPSSPVAPDALLRLGQALYTAGETERALRYLERLRSDYPGSPQRETGMLWLTRTQLANGNAAAACGTARESLFGTTNENVRMLIEIERDRACAQSGGVAIASGHAAATPSRNASAPTPDATGAQPRAARIPSANAAVTTSGTATVTTPANAAVTQPPAAMPAAQPAKPLPDLGIAIDENVREPAARDQRPTQNRNETYARTTGDTRPTTPAIPAGAAPVRAADNPARAVETAPVSTAEFAVQTAAFSQRRPAETIAAELRAKGFDVRIVQVPGSPYFRVRCGRYMTSSDAAAASLRIRDAGFATLVVNDVRLERRP